MSKDNEGQVIQMKIVESPKVQNGEGLKKRQRARLSFHKTEQAYDVVVKEALRLLDNKILIELQSTKEELQSTQELITKQAQKSERIIEQNSRYQSTLEKLLPSITEQVISNRNPHVVYSDSDWVTPDVVLVSGKVPAETAYRYTASMLGQFVGIVPGRMGVLLRRFEIFDDPIYHHVFSVGSRSVCHKYKLTALKEIFLRKADPKYASILKSPEVDRIHTFLKMKAQENAL